jgi:cysteinyl-tRNA synthetase
LFDLAREVNRLRGSDDAAAAAHGALLRHLAGLLGLLQREPQAFMQGGAPVGGLADADIERLIGERLEARRNKDWAASDRIRDELKAQGIVLEDGAGATTWRRA